MSGYITDVPEIKVGHESDQAAGTGCTVVICEKGAVGGVDVRGGAPGTRETDLLNPMNLVEKVHAVVLAGGSAFGLDAACGVMQYLEEKGIGFDVGVTRVPIVPACVLFDLTVGDYRKRPDREMGYRACLNATFRERSRGNVGAGTGATVGKLKGMAYAMKGGLGSSSKRSGDLVVGALVAVNAFGDVVDPNTGKILAGTLNDDLKTFASAASLMTAPLPEKLDAFSKNTTIGVVATNARLTKAQANKVASVAHNGYALSIRPVHTMFDGDTVFVMGTGEVDADVNAVCYLASMAVAEAVVDAVKSAEGILGFKSYRDLFPEDRR